MVAHRSLWIVAVLLWSSATLSGCGRGGSSSLLPQAVHATARHPKTVVEAAYPNAVLADAPIVYYRLDDVGATMADSSPNALAGSYGTAVVHGRSSLIMSNSDAAAGFPGTPWSASGIATVAPNTLLQPASLTVEANVQENAVPGTVVELVAYGPGGGQAWSLRLSASNTFSGRISTSAGVFDVTGTTTLVPGTNYHVAMTYDGSVANLYVNGAPQASVTVTGSIVYSSVGSSGLGIGGSVASARSTALNGTLDDVAVYGTALTGTRIGAHYAAATTIPTATDDPYAAAVTADAPTAYYRLDEATSTLVDATQNHLNGTYGTVTHHALTLIAGTADYSTRFPGTQASAATEATVPQSSLLQPTSAITVEAWARETHAPTTYLDLVSYGDQNGQGYALQISPTNHASYWMNLSGGATLYLEGSTQLLATTTYHLAATFDGTTARLYVNGVLDGTKAAAGPVSYAGIGSYGLSIGGGQHTTRNTIDGKVDEVAIYSAVLSAARIASHYAAGAGPAPTGPAHVANWQYACNADVGACVAYPGVNVGIAPSWMASHVDWLEVGFNPNVVSPPDTTSHDLAAAGAKHQVIYMDPNIAYLCPIPSGSTGYSLDVPETGTDNCDDYGRVPAYLHAQNGSYAHAYQHNAAGRRLVYNPYPLPASTPSSLGEPLNIGDPDVQAAFATTTLLNPYATDVMEDDGGGTYNCIENDNARCDGAVTYGAPSYLPTQCSVPTWCYLYHQTAVEWDNAGPGTAAQEKYLNDAINLANAAHHKVIGNNGIATNSYELRWLAASNVEGGMSEGAWNLPTDLSRWVEAANDTLIYHGLHKYTVAFSGTDSSNGGPVSTSALFFQIASNWVVYDPTYSIEALSELNGAAATAGSGDSTFPEESVVPSQPLVATPASNDPSVFQTSSGVFVREYATCFQDGALIGRCSAVINTNTSTVAVSGLVQTYGHVLVRNTTATWAAGGKAQWSTAVPTTIGSQTGLIFAQ